MIIPDDTLTVIQVAKRYRLTRAAVYLAIKQGKLDAHTLFGRLVITQDAIERWRANLGKPGRKKGRSKNHLTVVK